MHHLRVVTFDKVISEKFIKTSKTKLKRYHDHTIRPKVVSIQKEVKKRRQKVNTGTNTDKTLTKKGHTGFQAIKKISFASMSELIRNRTMKGNIFKSLTSIKTISLDDIRRTLINNVYGNKQKKKHKETLKENIAEKKAVKPRSGSQDDIKVLYSFERSKNPGGGGINTTTNNIKSNHFAFRRSSSDIFGIGGINRSRNTYLFFHTNRNGQYLPTPRRRKNKLKQRNSYQVYSLNIPNQNTRRSRFQESYSDHYNVVCFPRSSKANVKLNKLQVVDQEVSPCPSPTRILMDCRGDVAKRVSAEVLPERSSPRKIRLWPKAKPKPKRVCPIKNIHNPLPITTLYTLCQSSNCEGLKRAMKCGLKFILLALSVIVWSPCILAIAFCWLLVYPLKPHYVLQDDPKVLAPSCVKCKKKSYFSRIMEWTVKTSRRMAFLTGDVYRALIPKGECSINTLQSKPCQVKEVKKISPITRSKWQPNPGKKYVLFFDKGRGWLMKPLRNEVNDECKQSEVVQNLMLNRARNKAVKFSEGVLEGEGTSKEYKHDTCTCPSKSAISSHECTQTTCPEFQQFQQRINKPQNIGPTPPPQKKHSPGFGSSGPCIVCPPISICRPCPIRKRKAQKLSPPAPPAPPPKPKIKSKNRVDCKRCRYYASQYRRPPCKPRVPRKPFLSKATWQYIRGKEPEKTFAQSFCDSCKSCAISLKNVVLEADQVWTADNMACNSIYIQTLKKRPCFWIYRCCRSVYPAFLGLHRACCNLGYICLSILAMCAWCPFFCCCYLCCSLFCGGCK